MQLKDSVDEVLRKVGRNMMLFQQLEHLLKYVVANGNLSGYSSELKDIQAKKAEVVKKQTMGQLVGQFLENTNPDYEAFSDEPEVLEEPHISFRFRIETDPKNHEEKKQALADLVNQRNELIHHFLPKFDSTSQASCEDIGKKLDVQSEVIRREIKKIQAIVQAFNQSRKELASYLTSDEGQRELWLNHLKQSPLAMILIDIADQLGKEDGWVSLSLAAHLVRKHMPDELSVLRESYGHKTLKSFMLVTEMFEFNEEETSKGGLSVVYKLRQGTKVNHAQKAKLE